MSLKASQHHVCSEKTTCLFLDDHVRILYCRCGQCRGDAKEGGDENRYAAHDDEISISKFFFFKSIRCSAMRLDRCITLKKEQGTLIQGWKLGP